MILFWKSIVMWKKLRYCISSLYIVTDQKTFAQVNVFPNIIKHCYGKYKLFECIYSVIINYASISWKIFFLKNENIRQRPSFEILILSWFLLWKYLFIKMCTVMYKGVLCTTFMPHKEVKVIMIIFQMFIWINLLTFCT